MPTTKKLTKAEIRRRTAAKDAEFKRKVRASGKKLDKAGRKLSKMPERDFPMRDFWSAVDRPKLKEALKETGDPAMLNLATYLIENTSLVSLTKVCRDSGITLQKLNELYRHYNLSLGMVGVSNHLPQILSDTAEDAKSHYEVCNRCDGVGEVSRTRITGDKASTTSEICPKCRGEREVRVPGDSKARDQIFGMVGLTDKQQGPLVAIQQNTIQGGTLDDTLNLAQKLLVGGGSRKQDNVIDVEAENGND